MVWGIFYEKKVKNTVPWTNVISDVKRVEIVRNFSEKKLQKTNQKEFGVEKVIKKNGDKLYVKWKGYISSFNSWIGEKRYYKMNEYFPEPKSLGEKVKFELDWPNNVTKTDLKICKRC